MEENLLKSYLKFLIPTIATMTLFSSYTMVDGIFVGQGVGEKGLSAVNLAMPYVALSFAIAILVSVGALNIISYHLGRNEKEKANEFFSMTVVSSLIVGIVITVSSYLFLDELIQFLGADAEIFPFLKEYIRIIIAFIPFYIISYVFEVMIKADGFPQLSTVFMLGSAVTNIVLDYVFIFKMDMGISGAAIATGLAQVLPTIAYLIHFLSKKSRLKFSKFELDFSMFRKILSYGFPASLAEFSTGFIILLFNNKIGDLYGLHGLGSFSVIAYILTFVVNTMLAINQASQPLLAYHYGAKQYSNIGRLRKYMMMTVGLFSIIFFALIQVTPEFFVNVFISDYTQDFLNFSVKVLKIFSLSFLVLGFNICIGGYMTAVHKPKYDMYINLLRGYILISLFLFIIPKIFGAASVWYVLLISDLTCLIVSLYLLKVEVKELSFQEKGVTA